MLRKTYVQQKENLHELGLIAFCFPDIDQVPHAAQIDRPIQYIKYNVLHVFPVFYEASWASYMYV